MTRALFLVLSLITGPALANPWSCDGALSPSDRVLGTSDTKFTLYFTDTGQFRATGHHPTDSFRSWQWSGQWTTFDGEIAMIGAARTSYADPILVNPGSTTQEVRAFSTVFKDDVILMELKTPTYPDILVRCLSEHK